MGPDHRRAAARAGDADRDPAQEGGPGAAQRAAGGAGVHRVPDLAEHPRAGGRADPGDGVRLAQPAAGGPGAHRDRAQGPDPGRGGLGARDHGHGDHGGHGGLLRADRGGPVRDLPGPGTGDRPADRDVPVPGADGPVAAEDRGAVRRPGPHDRHARRPEDPGPDGGAAVHLQPGDRADQPHQERLAMGRRLRS
ncbi:hypothetical protein SGPA1_50271 [Streptomyces misionensis JCM 4497]